MKEAPAHVRAAVDRILDRLARGPLSDTWGCTHAGHLVTMIERLGLVSSMVQEVSTATSDGMPGAAMNYRRDLIEQLAELGGNVVVMLAMELEATR